MTNQQQTSSELANQQQTSSELANRAGEPTASELRAGEPTANELRAGERGAGERGQQRGTEVKYYTLLIDGQEKVAVSIDGCDLFVQEDISDMNDIILGRKHAKISAECRTVSADQVEILSPIPRPLQDVICLGMNYSAHEVEAARFSKDAFGGEKPKPVFFSKRVTYSQGTRKAIPSYQGLVDSLDYEVELGVILGKDARNIKAEDAEKYIFGYTVINDVSARNLQTSHRQWYFGKSLDGFTPMGPCIVTANEVSFPPSLEIRCWVNGELRQDSNTARLIHGIPEILETLSAGMTLKAGTIIATGTPAGVGMGFETPKFLEHGDEIKMEIEGVGVLENRID